MGARRKAFRAKPRGGIFLLVAAAALQFRNGMIDDIKKKGSGATAIARLKPSTPVAATQSSN